MQTPHSAFELYLIYKTYDEIHSYIYKYILTYRPTFSVNPTRESKDQIGMAYTGKLNNIHCFTGAQTKHCQLFIFFDQ